MTPSAMPEFIAEAGVNHNGDEDIAVALVHAAADAGADWVKFQTFRTANLVTRNALKAAYQKKGDATGDGQFEMLSRLELSPASHQRLAEACKERGINFLSTPFDVPSMRFLIDDLGLKTLKLGSGDLTNSPLLLEIGRSGRALILSTGMSDLETIRAALSILAFGYLDGDGRPCREAFSEAFAAPEGRAALARRVTLLHCVSAYPAPDASVNLLAMPLMATTFGLPVGYSDHTTGTAVAVAATALGACMLEKHLTLERGQTGPDHATSLEPDDFRTMIDDCRRVAEARGEARKSIQECEHDVRDVARKSLVAARGITEGTPLSERNLTVKRPGTGIDALDYFDWLGAPASRRYEQDDLIDE